MHRNGKTPTFRSGMSRFWHPENPTQCLRTPSRHTEIAVHSERSELRMHPQSMAVLAATDFSTDAFGTDKIKYTPKILKEMSRAYTLKGNCLIIHRDLTELDIFVRDFLHVLRKYSSYLIVSSFVSIATGRTRGTEDVDILFPVMGIVQFDAFFQELIHQGFWCYQGDTSQEVYRYVKKMTSIRFARKKQLFPNIELIPVTEAKRPQYFELTHPQKIKIQDFEFLIPPLEFEILYKEIVLAADKDIADARHLRTIFSDILRKERFKEFETIIKRQ